jgi:hypothetical protein
MDCLLPIADLFNHRFDPNVGTVFNPDHSISFIASRKLSKGEELFIKYGKAGDAISFWTRYGFYAHEGLDAIPIYFPVAFGKDDQRQLENGVGALCDAIRSLGVQPSLEMALPATKDAPLPGLWIWLLRLKDMSEDQREAFAKGQVRIAQNVEAAAWSDISTTLTQAIQWYAANTETEGVPETDCGECVAAITPLKLRRVVCSAAVDISKRALALAQSS